MTLHITTAARQGGRPRPARPHGQRRHQLPLHRSLLWSPVGGGGEGCYIGIRCSGMSRACGVLPREIRFDSSHAKRFKVSY
jgi:hypothetical protein